MYSEQFHEHFHIRQSHAQLIPHHRERNVSGSQEELLYQRRRGALETKRQIPTFRIQLAGELNRKHLNPANSVWGYRDCEENTWSSVRPLSLAIQLARPRASKEAHMPRSPVVARTSCFRMSSMSIIDVAFH
jgi:hypothetical protein